MTDDSRTPPPGFDDLPVEDQIEYVQSLWDRIAAHPERVAVPGGHIDELERRERSKVNADASPWEEVRERILRSGDRDK